MIRLLARGAHRLRRCCSSLKPPEELQHLLDELDRIELEDRSQKQLAQQAPRQAPLEQARLSESNQELSAEVQQLYREVNGIRTEQGLLSFFNERKDSLNPFVLTLIFKKLLDLFRLAKRAGDKATVEQFLQRDSLRPVFQVVVGNFKQLPPYYLVQVVESLVRHRVKQDRFFRDVELHMVAQLSKNYRMQEDKLFKTLALLLEAGHASCFDPEALALVAERAITSGTFDSPDRVVKLFYYYHLALRKLCDSQGLSLESVPRTDFTQLLDQLLPQFEIKHATTLLNALALDPTAKDSGLAKKLNAIVRAEQESGSSSRRLAGLLEIVLGGVTRSSRTVK